MPYATQGRAAIGTLFQRSTDGVNYTTVAEIYNITGPGGTATEIDVTHHQSDSGYKEFVLGLKDGETVTLEMNFLPAVAGQTVLRDDFENKTKQYWRLDFPDGSLMDWRGFVRQPPSPRAPVDGKLSGTATIRVSGPVTVTAGSS